VTFDFFSLNEAEATENGGGVTINNHLTLFPSPALPGVGSAFGVIRNLMKKRARYTKRKY